VNARVLQRLAIVLLLTLIVCCTSPRQTQIARPGSPITLTYWSATNAQELEFANRVSAEWNKQHAEVQIKIEPVPSGQSSEEVILAAIASGTTPDIYANVFPGAMQDLLDARGLVELDAYPDFLDVMRERMMPELLNQYRSADGPFLPGPLEVEPDNGAVQHADVARGRGHIITHHLLGVSVGGGTRDTRSRR